MGPEPCVLQAMNATSVSAAPAPTGLRAGTLPTIRPVSGRFGPYELVCQLASGGMGTVYVASRTHAEGVRRTVALKIIHPHLAVDSRFVRMFMAEAQLVSRISHPYVCRLSDIGRETLSLGLGGDGQPVPYVAMEYLVGEPLSRMLPLLSSNRSEFSTACIVRLLAQLCEGLHAAHEVRDEDGKPLNVVHRDISPDNLFLLYDGTVRIVDFGIAHADDHLHTVQTRGPQGKFAYMSPEQLEGEKLDRRSDIWSLGVVLWELLTAMPLIPRGSNTHAAHAVLHMSIMPPSSCNPHVPAELDEITLKALERDPTRRFDSALELAHALDQFLVRYYGPISAATLGNWLEAMFPGCRSYRQRILPNARKLLEESGPRELTPPITNQRSVPRAEKASARGIAGSLLRKLTTRASAVPLWAYSLSLTVLTLGVWMEARGAISSGQVSARAAEGGTAGAARAGQAQRSLAPRALGAARHSQRAATPVTLTDAPPLPAAERALPFAMGQVYVSTPGSSLAIELNGQVVGATPSRLELPVGSHVLHLRRKNAAPLPLEVKVTAGKVVFIEVPPES